MCCSRDILLSRRKRYSAIPSEYYCSCLYFDRRGDSARCTSKTQKYYQKKIATAIYLYQADCDGEWGEIYFDFVNRTTEIQKLAEWA
jgi:hypothetical protein